MVYPSLQYWRKRIDKGSNTFDNTILSHLDCMDLAILLEELYDKRNKLNNHKE